MPIADYEIAAIDAGCSGVADARDAATNLTQYGYDTENNLLSITNAAGT